MKLKPSEAVYFGLQKDGRIYIEQYSDSWGDKVRCYLSPEQFRAIASWFFNNQETIEDAWDMGVDNDPQA